MFLRKFLKLKKTLSFRLTVWYAVIFSLSSFMAFSIFYLKIYRITMSGVDKELVEKTQDLSASLIKAGPAQATVVIGDEAKEEDQKDIFIRLVSRNGRILASSDMSSWGIIEFPGRNIADEKHQSGYLFATLSFPGLGFRARTVLAPVGSGEFLQYGMKITDEEEYLSIFRNLFCLLFLGMISCSGLVGWFLARRGLRDVEEVTQTAMEISEGAAQRRVELKSSYEETARLVNAFNKMLDRIQAIHDAMRETNDNIAHDLRSPLARIRGIAEMSLVRRKSMENIENMAASTIEECDRLLEMINTMLEISEAEAGVGERLTEEIDLAKLIRDAHEIFWPIAEDKQITISLNIPDAIHFYGDRKKLQRIVTNLLENAIKYTPERGSVTISTLKEAGKIKIVFEDTGIGISQQDLHRIFDRFYRSEKSRTTDGIGLGLSLARAFVFAMGGTISAKSILGKGSTFIVCFPLQV